MPTSSTLNRMYMPDGQGRLFPLELPNLPAQPLVEKLDFTDSLKWGWGANTLVVPRSALSRHRIEFPEWGSGGDWTFLIARLFASGIKGKLVHRVGYLYRVTGTAHRSSTLRSIEEERKVPECLATDCDVPEAAKEQLRRWGAGIRKRLVVAALRERRWGKFA